MCGSMVDIQSPTAEISRGNKKEEEDRRNHRAKNIMSACATQGGHKYFLGTTALLSAAQRGNRLILSELMMTGVNRLYL